MILKCVALLAILGQINAFRCDQASAYTKPVSTPSNNVIEISIANSKGSDKSQGNLTERKSITVVAPKVPNSFFKPSPMIGGTLTRNLIAKGKYPVALPNYSIQTEKKIPVFTSHVRAPTQEKPTVRLPANIPPPKTVAHTCTCFKTILKPRVQQHLITVPSVQRYIETNYKPVIENIHYEAYPIISGELSKVQVVNDKATAQTFQVAQAVQVPIINIQQAAQTHQDQTLKNSKAQTNEFSHVHVIEGVKSQPGESSKITIGTSQTADVPQIQFGKTSNVQHVEMPRFQYVETQNAQTIEVPRFQYAETPTVQTVQAVQVPRIQYLEPQKVQTVEIPSGSYLKGSNVQNVEISKVRSMATEEKGETLLKTGPYCYTFNQ